MNETLRFNKFSSFEQFLIQFCSTNKKEALSLTMKQLKKQYMKWIDQTAVNTQKQKLIQRISRQQMALEKIINSLMTNYDASDDYVLQTLHQCDLDCRESPMDIQYAKHWLKAAALGQVLDGPLKDKFGHEVDQIKEEFQKGNITNQSFVMKCLLLRGGFQKLFCEHKLNVFDKFNCLDGQIAQAFKDARDSIRQKMQKMQSDERVLQMRGRQYSHIDGIEEAVCWNLWMALNRGF